MNAVVTSVGRSHEHAFTKPPRPVIRLLAGLGVEEDAHLGVTVQHQSRVREDPTQPNLRQIHLIHAELFTELAQAGFTVRDGDLGENITTRGIDLLGLPEGALLHVGREAVIEVKGLRNPCRQINMFAPGLMAAVLGRDADGNLIRKTGVMGIVVAGGEVRAGDSIRIVLPAQPHAPLKPV